MNTLMIVVGVIFGVALGILLIACIIYLKIRAALPKEYRSNTFGQMMEASKEIAREAASQPKYVGGMTNFLLPTIEKDFPELNIEELYTITEKNLRVIFNIIETKNIMLLTPELKLIEGNLRNQIDDLSSNDIEIKYDDVNFHKHAINTYEKKDGIATITIASALEYYYYYTKNGKCLQKSELKKQVKYLSTYIYIYDREKAKTSSSILGLNCPNCGAPVDGFQQNTCKFCGTHTIKIDLKSWKFISYKES